MKIDDEYRLPIKDLEFEVIELLDFKDYPILTLERNRVGSLFLSYLEFIDDDFEKRIVIPLSVDRLKSIKSGELSINHVFQNSETNYAYYLNISLNTGDIEEAFLFPSILIKEQVVFPENYIISISGNE